MKVVALWKGVVLVAGHLPIFFMVVVRELRMCVPWVRR